jgi:hypothetical protein
MDVSEVFIKWSPSTSIIRILKKGYILAIKHTIFKRTLQILRIDLFKGARAIMTE